MATRETNQSGDRRGVTISDRVPAGATNRKMRYRVPRDGTVEAFSLRIYSGAELDLEIKPYVVQKADEGQTDLIRMVGKDHLDGDDDVYRFDTSVPVEQGDEIVLSATNQDGSNAYDYRSNIEIDHAGGLSRLTQVIG